MLVGSLVGGGGLIYLGTQQDNAFRWVFFVAGGILLIGGLLYAGALQGEVRRTPGPLPLGEPGEDRTSMPLYQGKNLPE